MGRYRDAIYRALVNYAEIFYKLRYELATKTDTTVLSFYKKPLTLRTLLVIDFLIPNGML